MSCNIKGFWLNKGLRVTYLQPVKGEWSLRQDMRQENVHRGRLETFALLLLLSRFFILNWQFLSSLFMPDSKQSLLDEQVCTTFWIWKMCTLCALQPMMTRDCPPKNNISISCRQFTVSFPKWHMFRFTDKLCHPADRASDQNTNIKYMGTNTHNTTQKKLCFWCFVHPIIHLHLLLMTSVLIRISHLLDTYLNPREKQPHMVVWIMTVVSEKLRRNLLHHTVF